MHKKILFFTTSELSESEQSEVRPVIPRLAKRMKPTIQNVGYTRVHFLGSDETYTRHNTKPDNTRPHLATFPSNSSTVHDSIRKIEERKSARACRVPFALSK